LQWGAAFLQDGVHVTLTKLQRKRSQTSRKKNTICFCFLRFSLRESINAQYSTLPYPIPANDASKEILGRRIQTGSDKLLSLD